MSFINSANRNSLKRSPDWNEVFKIASPGERFVTLCNVIHGLYFQSTIHPSAIVVTNETLSDYVPLCLSPDRELASQYCRDDLKAMGMTVYDSFA